MVAASMSHTQLVLAGLWCLVVGALAQSNSNNPTRQGEAIEANVQFLQQLGLSQQEARLLSDSAATPGAEIPILEDVRDGPHHDGSYYFRYTSADGSTREEGGIPTAPCTQRVTGSYSYIAPNAVVVDMQYVADENGYRAFPSGTRPDLYTAPVRVPEPIYPVGYFDGIPCPGDEFNQGGGDQIPAASINGNRRPVITVRPPTPPRPATGNGGSLNGNQGRPIQPTQGRPINGGGLTRPTRAPVTQSRPSNGGLGRPTPSTQGGQNGFGQRPRPNNGGQGRPTPSTQGRPINFGQTPTSSTGGQGRPTPFGRLPTVNQGSFGQRQTTLPSQGITSQGITTQADFKTPTSFITAASTNFNNQNNFNTGGTTINDGYTYTEPPRKTTANDGYTYTEPPRIFTFGENALTTDVSVGPQTTAIEPLTQLYESPNY